MHMFRAISCLSSGDQSVL